MADLTGRCFCGETAWTSDGPVLWAGHCHCDSCRRATSSPFTSFFGVPRASTTFTGALSHVTTSNGDVTRAFCAACGSHMFYQYAGWPDETHLYAATLTDPKLFEPKAHFHYAERLPWVETNDNLPKYPGSTDSSDPVL